MKICTACNTTYSDDTLNFCLVDGTTLTPERNLSSNQPFSYNAGSWSGTEIPTQAANQANFTQQSSQPPPTIASFSPTSPYVPRNFSSAPPAAPNRGLMYAAIIAGAVIFGVVVGVLIAANWNRPTGANNSTTVRNSAVNTTVNNAVTVSNAKVSSNSSSTNTSNTTQTNSTFNLIGTWSGKFNDAAGSLNITAQNGETFSGTLITKGYTVEITGQINNAKRAVSIRETKVLKTPAGSIWNLGQDNGTISESGKTMSGTGKDKNVSYRWSFTKQ